MDTSINYDLVRAMLGKTRFQMENATWRDWEEFFDTVFRPASAFEALDTRSFLDIIIAETNKQYGQLRGRFESNFESGFGINTPVYLSSRRGVLESDEVINRSSLSMCDVPRWKIHKGIMVYPKQTYGYIHPSITFYETRFERNDAGEIIKKELKQYSLDEQKKWEIMTPKIACSLVDCIETTFAGHEALLQKRLLKISPKTIQLRDISNRLFQNR